MAAFSHSRPVRFVTTSAYLPQTIHQHTFHTDDIEITFLQLRFEIDDAQIGDFFRFSRCCCSYLVIRHSDAAQNGRSLPSRTQLSVHWGILLLHANNLLLPLSIALLVNRIIWNRQSLEANVEFFLHSLLTLPITSTTTTPPRTDLI